MPCWQLDRQPIVNVKMSSTDEKHGDEETTGNISSHETESKQVIIDHQPQILGNYHGDSSQL